MYRLVCALAALLLTLAAVPGPTAAEPVVRDIRIGAHKTKTRVVLDMSAALKFDAFVLSDPYRVVIDLPEVDWRTTNEKPARPGVITAFRYGHFEKGTSRLVLDVNRPVKVAKSFVLPPGNGRGYRLVIDLVNISRTELLAARAKARAGAAPAPTTPVPTPKPKASRTVIVIDPGHGGVDPGTIGARGTWEKHIALAYARELKKALEKTTNFEVYLTRNRDIFLPLRRRIAIARSRGADLFLSLHADSIANRRLRGAHVYTLSEDASDAEAEALAAKENKADLIAGVDLSGQSDDVTNILIDLAQRETMNQSAIFARMLIGELRRTTKVIRKSHRFAGFAVLKAPDVPSVLVELGYLSNPAEERLLRLGSHRRKVTSAIARGVELYFARQQAANQP